MSEQGWYEERKVAVHLRRSGLTAAEVARRMKRSVSWVHKYWRRYRSEGWVGLHSRSRAPKHKPNQLSEMVREAICQARSELEAEAAEEGQLHYIGAGAVQARLAEKEVAPLPSTASIERVMRAAQLTRPRQKGKEERVNYPRLQATQPGQVIQIDIVPHYLQGGQAIACFNALDVVSRYPTGQAFERRRSLEASEFLLHVWQEIGLADYTQFDNEGCFSGGFTHPGVLGKVLRLGLYVGTELVFTPFYSPEVNGSVERFHQDYDQHVWQGTNLRNREEVQQHADRFFSAYRHSRHHSALRGYSPAEAHEQPALDKLTLDFQPPPGKLPLTEGKVHFIRQVNPDLTISVLNLTWSVPNVEPNQGVWATLVLQPDGAKLRVYDQTPQAEVRHCLAEHPFPLNEPVLPYQAVGRTPIASNPLAALITGRILPLARVKALFSTMF